MFEVLNIHAEGEGYIVYLLLKSLVADGNLNLCLRFLDRPIFPKEGKNIALLPKLEENLKPIYLNLEKVQILSKDCKDLKNCQTVEGDFILSTLRVVLKELEPSLVERLEKFQFEAKEINQTLLEKLSFYIPLLVGKRESVAYAWKYYLGLKGVPSVSFLYPRDFDLLKEVVFNPAFGDKIFPLLLGRVSKEVENLLKEEGLVPYRVEVEGKDNLDSELKLIVLAKSVAKNLKKLV